MKKLLLTFLISLFLFSCEKESVSLPEAKRVVLVYLVAENDLEGYLKESISLMEKGLKSMNKSCELLIYWDGNSGYGDFPDPAILKYEMDESGNLSQCVLLKKFNEQNSLDPSVMTSVLKDMCRLAPSEHYGLIMGSHAVSWLPADMRSRSFGVDNGIRMEIPDLAGALEGAFTQPLDFLLLDACLMAGVEVAFELRNVTEYLIASSTEVLAYGFPYANIMPLLYSDHVADYTEMIIKKFVEYYQVSSRNNWATGAVIKCAEMEQLAAETYSLMAQYKNNFTSDFEIDTIQRYDRSLNYNGLIVSGYSYDFNQFMKALSGNNLPYSFTSQLNRTVVYKDLVKSSLLFYIDQKNYSGIGTYIPQASKPKWNEYYHKLGWYAASGWNLTDW